MVQEQGLKMMGCVGVFLAHSVNPLFWSHVSHMYRERLIQNPRAKVLVLVHLVDLGKQHHERFLQDGFGCGLSGQGNQGVQGGNQSPAHAQEGRSPHGGLVEGAEGAGGAGLAAGSFGELHKVEYFHSKHQLRPTQWPAALDR